MLRARNAGHQFDREDEIECGQLQLFGDGGGVEGEICAVSGVCTHGWGVGWVDCTFTSFLPSFFASFLAAVGYTTKRLWEMGGETDILTFCDLLH